MGERKRGINFGFLEVFQIENNSLQVNDNDVRQATQEGFLRDFLLLVAWLAEIIINSFWLYEFFETISQLFHVFNFQG